MATREIPDDVRASVAEAMRARHAGKPTVREIAEAHGIAPRSVQRIAQLAGLHSDEARALVKNASEQVRQSNKELRAELAARLLHEARAAMDEIGNGSVVTGVSFGEVVCRRVGHTTAKDRQALLTGAAIALDKHRMLDAYDASADNTDVAAWLEWMSGAPRRG